MCRTPPPKPEKSPYSNLIFATAVGATLLYLFVKRRSIVGSVKRRLNIFDPLSHYKPPIIVDTEFECEKIAHNLRKACYGFPAVGFDCEWLTCNGNRRRVALLQLASPDGTCALIRLCSLERIPCALKDLLEEQWILKVGVDPCEDARFLLQDYGIHVRSCLDLRHLMLANGGDPTGGLGGLSQRILGVTLDKNWKVRCSNWENITLSSKQIEYAALDAMVALEMLVILMEGKTERGCLSQRFMWDMAAANWKLWDRTFKFLDVRYKRTVITMECNTGKYTTGILCKPTPKKQPSRAFMTRQSPMYQNCYMQAPDGEVLCTCDRKKAEWYVMKDLAVLVRENPLTVRLRFEPAGRVVDEAGLFYTQEKANCCVVCGRTDSFLRKNIVPHEYRKYFPRVMKDHTSHDVLLLCLDCHLQSNTYDTALRHKLSIDCDAPIGTLTDAKFVEVPDAKRARMAARALLNYHNIPESRRKELKRAILNYYKNRTEVTESLILEASHLDTGVLNKDYVPHGLRVVQYFSSVNGPGLVQLERMWREHFLDTMKPRFLPALWSVTHNRTRLTKRAEENRVLAQELNAAGLGEYAHLLKDKEGGVREPPTDEERRALPA